MKKWTIILFVGLVSCNKAQRQLEKTQLYLFKHPEFTAEVCAEKFETKPDSVIVYETKTDTLWELIQFYDTTSTNDTIRITDHKTKVVTKTIWRDSIIYRENKAEQERVNLMLIECQRNNNVLLAKLDAVEKDRDEWKGKARKKGWMFWGLVFLVVGAVGMRMYLQTKKIKL